ncbi:MAG: hypothetical protein NTW85_03325 [Methylococcales bacterium]|nr:hypothetical protein [Methylococcales bacterium]
MGKLARSEWHTVNVLKELGGWSDLTIVMRYAYLSSEHLASYADNASLSTVTNPSQLAKKA